jgi:hypothetical protein
MQIHATNENPHVDIRTVVRMTHHILRFDAQNDVSMNENLVDHSNGTGSIKLM